MLRNVLIVVNDIEKSIQFYKDIFGLQVLCEQEGNVILSEGLVLQEAAIWTQTIGKPFVAYNNMTGLYFETFDMDVLLEKYESGTNCTKYLTPLTELDNGQKMVRFYDPSGNLIEVRTRQL